MDYNSQRLEISTYESRQKIKFLTWEHCPSLQFSTSKLGTTYFFQNLQKLIGKPHIRSQIGWLGHPTISVRSYPPLFFDGFLCIGIFSLNVCNKYYFIISKINQLRTCKWWLEEKETSKFKEFDYWLMMCLCSFSPNCHIPDISTSIWFAECLYEYA